MTQALLHNLELQDELLETMMCSSFVINVDSSTAARAGAENVKVNVSEATMAKCPRCWRFSSETEGGLCGRCDDVVAAFPVAE